VNGGLLFLPTAEIDMDLNRYLWGAILRDVARRGRPPGHEPQDLVQEAHQLLAELLGPKYEGRIEEVFRPDSQATPAEAEEVRRSLHKAISRAIGRARWTAAKRKQRGGAQEVTLDEAQDVVTPASTPLVDMALDLSELFRSWSELERQIWQCLCDGMTTREISARVGDLSHQRVAEVRLDLIRQVAKLLDMKADERAAWLLNGGRHAYN
jgi:hypothetical protein